MNEVLRLQQLLSRVTDLEGLRDEALTRVATLLREKQVAEARVEALERALRNVQRTLELMSVSHQQALAEARVGLDAGGA